MNEDPTVPIGELTPVTQGPSGPAPAGSTVPALSAAWGGFTLLARVGHGGFGEVYRAWDRHLQREVALKLLLPGAVSGEAEYEAMLREARALASVRHPNIVPVYGIDRHDGRVGFWTDFVRGKTLSVLVREQGTFGAREAALIGLDVARALSAVHRAGLLHRDIKAENVMREEGGRILLMDFGLSALEQRQTNIAGTPNYMAPELFEGGKSTVASDIYAMGVLLYFLVAGDYPVHLGGLTPRAALDAFPRRKPLMDLRPDLPESLLRTVSTATDMDPAKRFQSAGQLANALAESLGTHAPVEVSAGPERGRRQFKHRPWMYAAEAVAVIAIYLFWPGHLQKMWHAVGGSGTRLTHGSEDTLEAAQHKLLHSYKESNLADAVKGFEAVLQTDKDNAMAEAGLGAAHFIQYKYSHDAALLEKSKEEANRAKELNDKLAAPYITLSHTAAVQGNTDMAMQWVNKALEKEPRSAEAHGALGEVYEAQGKGAEAIGEYQKAVDLAPQDWRWPVSMGVAEFEQGKVQESIEHLKDGLALAPQNVGVYYDLSVIHSGMGKLEEARDDLEKAKAIEPTDRTYSSLGSVFLLEGKYDQAAAMYKKAIEMNPNSYMAYYNLGDAYQRSGAQDSEMLDAFRKAAELEESELKIRPQDPLLVVTLAFCEAQLSEKAKSEIHLRQALALDAEDPTVHYIAGETYESLGMRDRAIPLIAYALAHDYRVFEFERNPRLESLRSDPKFASALKAEKEKK
jgi:eukaryotic-like serine/threonine-protein kinase